MASITKTGYDKTVGKVNADFVIAMRHYLFDMVKNLDTSKTLAENTTKLRNAAIELMNDMVKL